MKNTQLLCTFCPNSAVEATIKTIIDAYNISFDTIYVLDNLDDPTTMCLTYNVDTSAPIRGKIPEATISLHRKKATNTLYTINALNLLIQELNNGKIDKNFVISWDNYKNTILVTAYNKLKKINTKLNRIINIKDM
jgi:hypothetical protein